MNGSVFFSISGQPGYGYILQTTTNLAVPGSWHDLMTNVVGVTPCIYTIPNPGNNPLRFYRVKSP